MALTISRLSKEYVRVPVSATEAGVAVDPSLDTVQMAFTAPNTEPSAWLTASWESDATHIYARIVVGPSQLAAGPWWVWVKVTDNPEIPVLRAGEITVA